MKTRLVVTGLIISTEAWSAVAVHEPAEAKHEPNYLQEGSFASGTTGAAPPRPWKSSNYAETRVTVETPPSRQESERWLHLVDDSDKANANIRQTFAPIRRGRFQARLISNKDGGRLFFNFGSGAAAKPEERAFQLNVESDGSLTVRGVQKPKTSVRIKTGDVYLVRCDFEPASDGKSLRISSELIDENTQARSRIKSVVQTTVAITALRVTSIGSETGVDYFVTDLSLTSR